MNKKNTSPDEIQKHIESLGNRIECQSTEYPKSDFPDAKEIIPYIHNLISKKNDRL